MQGSINGSASLSGKMHGNINLIGSVNEAMGLVGTFEKGVSFDTYDGEYEVTPSSKEQVLNTMQKMLVDNVTVHSTPYSEVSNPYGGTTVTIL